ncbi:TRAP transporter substrate-binding protein DctP [Rhodovulum sulfidophilum]|uniref:TRAP transporter substrate-binding protein DctP n=1 Tax=Rhodovulum sulfidophilum TaxID=35806 RepID=UPI00192432E7|nr:TRAP transporter substrate-binding protein DctP [Rhodovulum sulfidophilum]MBL3597843.1 TRAP transporter substrate-binding protein DctP [Rhodovulum sulfidophilum]
MKLKHLLAGAVIAAAAGPAAAQTLQIQASGNSGSFVDLFYKDWAERFNRMTGEGRTQIEILPFQAVVPYRETLDAIGAGILAGDMQAVSYFAGRDQAFSIIGDLISGYDTPDQVSMFCQYGGGKEVLQEAYDSIMPGQLHVVGCAAFTREALVSAVEINGVDDLKGLNIRAPEGLATAVFEAAGASPVPLPYSEVFSALEQGVIDAADASSYADNARTGVHEVAPYPLYPGIHSMAVLQLVIGQRQWEAMSEADQLALDTWYTAMMTSMARASFIEDERVKAEEIASGTVTVIDWPQEERDKLRAIAVGAWEAAAAQSDLAEKALETHRSFMKKIGLLD